MAFVRLATFPGGTAAHYAALSDEIGAISTPPGRLLFAAGAAADDWQVVQVWESRAGLEEFNRSVFGPAFARVGSRGFPTPPIVVDFETVALDLGWTS